MIDHRDLASIAERWSKLAHDGHGLEPPHAEFRYQIAWELIDARQG